MKEKQWTPSTKGELVEGLDKELVCLSERVWMPFFEISFSKNEQLVTPIKKKSFHN